MPKQTGIHKLRGKLGEVSYYRSQVGGDLARSINPAMSGRVKNDPAFANTRLNAAEFGGAGKLAGAMVSAVTQRWRYILDPVATGKLSSIIKTAMSQDTTNPWGEREVLLAQMPAIQDAYNALSKNEMLPEVSSALAGAVITESAHTVYVPSAEYSVDTAARLLSLGAEGVIVTMFTLRIQVPRFDPATGKYVSSSRYLLRQMYSQDSEIAPEAEILTGDDFVIPSSRGVYYNPQNTDTHLGGLLVVCTPYKVVSNQKHILQELCSCHWVSTPSLS